MCQASDILRRAHESSAGPTPAPVPYLRRAPRRVDAHAKMIVLGTGGGGMPKRTRTGYADEGRADFTKNLVIHEIGVHHDSYVPDIDIAAALTASMPSGVWAITAAPPMEPIEIMPTDANGVRVTAILVQHAPVFPALLTASTPPADRWCSREIPAPAITWCSWPMGPTSWFTRSSASTFSLGVDFDQFSLDG